MVEAHGLFKQQSGDEHQFLVKHARFQQNDV
jgi:hypothetical protein